MAPWGNGNCRLHTEPNAQEAAAFERECSEAVAEKVGRGARGMFVPSDVQKRDLTVGSATQAGNPLARSRSACPAALAASEKSPVCKA